MGSHGHLGVMPRAQVTLPFTDALAANTVSASLVISNMDAEGDGMDSNSTVSVRGFTLAQWEAAVRRAFTAWPGGGSAVAEDLLSAYAEEAAIDPQLAYDAINTDFGLTCAAQALGARLARGSLRKSVGTSPRDSPARATKPNCGAGRSDCMYRTEGPNYRYCA